MSKPKEYSSMTKDKLMTYTFIALLAITIVTAVIWWPVTPTNVDLTKSPMNLGLTVIICALVALGVSVGIDFLFNKLVSDSPLNIMSAAVFALIVTDSYTLGVPAMNTEVGLPVDAPGAFVYIALICLVGMVVFKKVMSLMGRKMVNPAAAAKFLIFLPSLTSVLIAVDHLKISLMGFTFDIPRLAGAIGYTDPTSFGGYMAACFDNPSAGLPGGPAAQSLNQIMLLQKFHGWVGGASSIAVIIAGIALFIVARRFIKWRITLAYFVTIAVMSLLLSFAYADADLTTRLLFEVFIGSSIFLGFFMATDPASTPLTYMGQAIFGVGLGVLTVLIQTYLNFFGGSILALIIMNLMVGNLDKIGRFKPTTESKEPKLPKAQAFAAEKVKEYQCIRCGACMRVCCHKLSPIVIKTAYDKMNFDALSKLNADYCTGCGHCTFVCPARIDLRKSVLMAKAALRGQ
jgi:Na+-translocating ferredoxin:NAD+ oxidoreductase RnfD subunit/NAD-dependent dihydropyrimidine dehydrogenase PreA subunit